MSFQDKDSLKDLFSVVHLLSLIFKVVLFVNQI